MADSKCADCRAPSPLAFRPHSIWRRTSSRQAAVQRGFRQQHERQFKQTTELGQVGGGREEQRVPFALVSPISDEIKRRTVQGRYAVITASLARAVAATFNFPCGILPIACCMIAICQSAGRSNGMADLCSFKNCTSRCRSSSSVSTVLCSPVFGCREFGARKGWTRS